MMNNIIATSYISEKFKADMNVPPFKELYPIIKNNLEAYCKAKGLKYNKDEKLITYKNSVITYNLHYSHTVRRYFLSFIPKNVWKYARKSQLADAFNTTLEFYNSLKLSINVGSVEFSKVEKSKSIDISNWKFKVYGNQEEIALGKLSTSSMDNFAKGVFQKSANTITRNLVIIDGSNIIDKLIVNKLNSRVKKLFSQEPEIIKYDDAILETISQRTDKENLFVLFIGSPEDVDKNYSKFKNFCIPNRIPSQFITIQNLNNKLKFGLSNFIFEIIKKGSKYNPIALQHLNEIPVDGFLCLSDLPSKDNNKYFGTSISFAGGDEQSEEYLEIYNDINYKTEYDKITFGEGQISLLSKKIGHLTSLKRKIIDVYLTKKWKTQDISFFSSQLGKAGITVRKFIYISQKSNRLIFNTLTNWRFQLKHSYFIIDKKVASIQTNTELKLYGTMFPLYLEVLNPWEQDLDETDLITLIWLVKKRIYRIKSFYSLKLPELMTLFSEAKKMEIENVSGTLKIGINHLL